MARVLCEAPIARQCREGMHPGRRRRRLEPKRRDIDEVANRVEIHLRIVLEVVIEGGEDVFAAKGLLPFAQVERIAARLGDIARAAGHLLETRTREYGVTQ